MYDVFISFRGEDTRRNFTSHLHSALDQARIVTYTDDDLKKGHAVWPALRYAIENSFIAIVVFSRNYATSKWCLKELVKILKCRKSRGQVVIPVFYKADPSHIRKQTSSYGEAFAKHERGFSERDKEYVQKKVSKWKAALTEAANICGWDSRSRDYKNDSQLIDKIVEDVSEKLDLMSPYGLGILDFAFVEIDKICEDVKLLLSKNQKKNRLLKNYQVIGIWGMGGIGKTTIAKAVFSQIFAQYDSVCFLPNVREESKRLGLTFLRDRLLSELLRDGNHNLVGTTFITRRLSNKKVFIVLDDVDSEDQLYELCKECDHAGPDSKLIITTRNRHLLSRIVDEDDIYDVKTLSFEKSLELFSLHAFYQRHPEEGYEDISKRAVKYAGGVPLALKVLGSKLYSKSIDIWDKELEKLKNYPNDRIQNVLQVSYDGLDSLEKKIFLDIAFFFKDEHKDYVVRILNACGFHATSGIEVLKDRALITFSNSQRIQMHDLLQEVGLKVVRQDIEDPGKRSRLRNIEEVSDVLENKKGSDAVEGIKLNLSEIGDLNLNADAFNMMTNLRFLILYIPANKRSGNLEYPRVFNKFPSKLRYLEWHGYRLSSLPPTFSAKMLVEIRMPQSHVKELWSGVKDLVNLEGIDLSECKKLKNLPDLSKAPKLKWVNLTGCESLLVVHPSLLSLDGLITLTLDNCKKLKSLKSDKHLKSLKKISVDGCTSLKEFSVSSDRIVKLDLSKTGVEILHSSIGNLTSLCSLNLEGLRLRNLPNELSSIRYLEDLRISNCRVVLDKEKLHVLFEGLTGLRKLYLKDCCKMSELPDDISGLSQLYELRLDASSVERLPESIRHLNNLEILSLQNCWKLRRLPELPRYIKEFNAVNCRSLVTVSTLNTFAEKIIGKDKFISFQNCLKLDGPSLHCIMEGAQLTMMNALTQNEYVRKYGLKVHSYNYTSIRVCFPGSKVPEQFTCRTTGSSIPIKLPSDSNLQGIILCAVLSPSEKIKKHGAKIFCQCYLADGTKLGYATRWYLEAITELNSDHVYMWYDAFHFDSIVTIYERQVSFMFYVTNDNEERDVLNVSTKECGVCLIFDPKSQHTATVTALGRSVGNECNDINNQETDLSERCSCSCDCLLDILRCLWRLIST